MKWEHATSYRGGQVGVLAPKSWATTLDGIRIFVTCEHIGYEGSWIIRAAGLGIDLEELDVPHDASSEEARDKAIEVAWHAASLISIKMLGVSNTLFSTPNLNTTKD
jgi:hypothetical protein